MSREWILEYGPATMQGAQQTIRLALRDSQRRLDVDLVSTCQSFEAFQNEIAHIKAELDQLLDNARREMEAVRGKTQAAQAVNPEAAWGKMKEFATDEEMLDYFNSFDEEARQTIAEYVFTHVNMFKGRGPVFSERYNSASHLLE